MNYVLGYTTKYSAQSRAEYYISRGGYKKPEKKGRYSGDLSSPGTSFGTGSSCAIVGKVDHRPGRVGGRGGK